MGGDLVWWKGFGVEWIGVWVLAVIFQVCNPR